MEKFIVTFLPINKSVSVLKDSTILSAAISADIFIASPCGGDGVCGRCKVVVKKGNVVMQSTGLLSDEEKNKGLCLACLSLVQSDLVVEIPQESAIDFEKVDSLELKKVYTDVEEIEPPEINAKEQALPISSLTEKIYLELPPPDLDDKVSDLERLLRQARLPANTNLTIIRSLSSLVRDADWKVTVTLVKQAEKADIINLEPGDTSKDNFGLSFDIGTTTLSGQLINLNTKKVLGTKVTYNKQASFGSDVITRIIYAREPDGLEKLHRLVVESMNQMIQELIHEHKVNLNDVTAVLCAGNTTMIHLLLRIDPTHIRKEPYVPTVNFLPIMRAHEAGIKINPHGVLFCVSGVASYVGGDITAGVLSCGIYKEKDLSVLIDIGTNGEIVLGNEEFLIACAASAGPAFEGSGVSCGMRATRGAVQKVTLDKDFNIVYSTIAQAKAKGICGSGYIDLISQMLMMGALDKDGKIKPIKHKRIRETDLGREFIVVFKEDTDSSSDIVINDVDIENLKRAKAAIYSATSSLIRHMGLDFSQVNKIFIAGGFGTSLDMDSAISIGLLPDLDRNKFIFVGNSSLAGARQMILSEDARKTADQIAHKMTYFELSVDAGYMDEYMAALFFPHTDLNKFPSVSGNL